MVAHSGIMFSTAIANFNQALEGLENAHDHISDNGHSGNNEPAPEKGLSESESSGSSKAAANSEQYSKEPPVKTKKLKGNQGRMDEQGNIWKKDMKHKDHWDVTDPKTGKKVKEVDFNGNQIWPDGPKNKNKR
jgi:hypothetical protein